MRESIEYLNAELDIRIVNRKKRIMEALVSICPRFSIKKGAIIGVDSLLEIPLMYQGVIGKVTHLIEFQDSFYIRASFGHDLACDFLKISKMDTTSTRSATFASIAFASSKLLSAVAHTEAEENTAD